jgi:hypothetical protein
MEKNSDGQKGLSRRDFLKISSFAGVTAIGGYLLSEYTPWLNYDKQVVQSRSPLSNDSQNAAKMREMVRYATLAANGHNTQPWKFAIKEKSIEIHPDYTRRLPVVDPNDREMWISLGCALENLLITARSAGYSTEVIYPSMNEYIEIQIRPDTPQGGNLFNAIPMRQNTRSEYSGQLISTSDYDQLQQIALDPGVSLDFAATPDKIEMFLEYVNQGNLKQYADSAFINELIFWLRFNKKEALSTMDGLYSRCSGNPEVPRWLGKSFVSGTKPEQQADADAKKLRSSSGAFVISSETDDKTGWVRTGQVYERIALLMTTLNIQSAFLNQPIEMKEVRGQFQQALGLGNSMPQLLVRFGYADPLPQSLRRPVDQVLI